MGLVVLVEKQKEGKDKPRVEKYEQSLAEKVLRKSSGWTLPDDSPFVFKDGSLIEKAKKPKTDKK